MSDRSETDCVSNDLVERVARAMWEADGAEFKDLWADDLRVYEKQARAAIAVLRPALRAEALEEAAKVAEECAPVSQDTYSMELAERCDMVAAAIRALINGDKND